ncbi:MAG: o-succinylbenzoate--CoA ligase [Caldilineaceae bacterium SB0670_bin_27]|uniref:2-succinylbenzoate--CoA ligase n=1 Tax=Caldilineaceae bacterium SB0664_bin_27 TaxID=2605260 RepID=A0A6B0YVJ1_9CHLR|nr:o-succinylbenzoate--CoA ligase [Caldilineaceae bacterium SB0664_bin_27]MYJ79331.1 o-succinylbenzoate--CoA ligase [Caldilineaceae bacterium SB0670_bin_27]
MLSVKKDWLYWRALATPGKTAVVFEGRSVSYAELDRMAAGQAAGLTAQGIQSGDKVAARLENSLEAVALIHAVARIDAVFVPLNTRLTAAEIGRQLNLVEPALLVVDDEPVGKGDESSGQWPGPAPDVQTLLSEPMQTVSLAKLGGDEHLIGRGAGSERRVPHQQEEGQLQSIVFTSGSTGTPKGVQLSFANHFWSATASAFRLGVGTEDRWLSCLPLYHVSGLAVVFRSCLYGTAVVLQRRFQLEEFQSCLRENRVTQTSLVPTLLHRLLHSSPATEWPQSLRTVLIGGAAASPELLHTALEEGVPVAPTYGLTEAATQAATALPADVRRKPGTVGRPLLFTELRIADSDGRPLHQGEVGEILVRGPQVTTAYYRNPTATAAALQGGWLRTGDMGRVDSDGDLFVLQRRADLIVSGGENIYPVEVETVLREHPAVADVCVVGLPDAEWGQRCAAAVQLHAGKTVTRDELLAFSRGRLAGYKQPSAKHIRFVDALPETASGKIARRAVRTMFEG